MKNLVYILFFVFSFANVFSQDVQNKSIEPKMDSSGVYIIVDDMPEYSGGNKEMIEFLKENMNLPKGATGGKVFIKFVIDTDGSVTKVRVLKSSGNKAQDDEAIRVVSMMPKWVPGKVKGKAVQTYFNLPINFKVK